MCHILSNRQPTGLPIMLGREIAVAEIAVSHFFKVVYHNNPLRFVAVDDVLRVLSQQVQQIGTAQTVYLIDVFGKDIEHGLPTALFT